MTTRQLCEACAGPIGQALHHQVIQSGTAVINPFPDNSIYERLASNDARFTIDAFRFVHRVVRAALSAPDATIGQHVSGRDVAEAFRSLALGEFGTAALSTLAGWGIRSTADIGTVVFRMVEFGILGARAEDKPEDFHSVYDFSSAFRTGA